MHPSRGLRPSIAVILFVAMIVLPLLVKTPAVGDDGPVRILLVGDSITHGWNGDYTWRFRLWKEFQRQGKAADFVGSRSLPYIAKGYTTASYADPNFDRDHFARAGAQLSQQVDGIASEVASQTPDVVVVASGVNDLIHGATAQETAAHLQTFIDDVRSVSPTATILVSPVLHINWPTPGVNDKIDEYDALAAGVVSDSSSAESPVYLAPTRTGWSPTTAFVQDGLHLTPKGEYFVANRIAQAMHNAGILPTDPTPVPATVPWVRNIRAILARNGNYVRVDWDTEALTGARILWRRRDSSWQVRPTTAKSVTMPLIPGATYDFRIQGVRHLMVSTPGAIATLKAAAIARVAHVSVRAARVTWSRVYGAATYHVHYRHVGSRVWHTRTTRGTSLRVHAAVARVSASNAYGSSAPTTGHR